VNVVDLTSVLFGPYAAQTLADWGANVTKVESLDGDAWRYVGQFRHRGMSGQFMAVNRNKRSLALDLKQASGKDVLLKLLEKADVLVTNVRPAGMNRLGLGYEVVHEINPRLIYAIATGFGQDGPWAARPAFDEIIQASSGFASSIGTDDKPEFVPSLVGDKICGCVLASAICAALFRRENSGMGQLVEVPMLETLASFNSIEMLGGHAFVPPIGPVGYKRMKERRPARTSDGWITMLPYSGDNWSAFFQSVGRPELIVELEVHDPVRRAGNIDKIYDRMSEIAITRTTAEWESLLLALDIPHAAFTKMTELQEQHHLKAVDMFVPVDHPTEGVILQGRSPAKFSESPANVYRAAPLLGGNSREVMKEVGYSESEIDDLIAANIVGVPH
jgi:formyl-CoA transferase